MQKKKPLKQASEFFQYLYTKMNCQNQLSTFMVFCKLGMLIQKRGLLLQVSDDFLATLEHIFNCAN